MRRMPYHSCFYVNETPYIATQYSLILVGIKIFRSPLIIHQKTNRKFPFKIPPKEIYWGSHVSKENCKKAYLLHFGKQGYSDYVKKLDYGTLEGIVSVEKGELFQTQPEIIYENTKQIYF